MTSEQSPGHRCHVYRDPAEKANTLARFLADGLSAGAKCRVIAYASAPDRAVGALAGAGFDIAQAMFTDALDIVPASSTPLLAVRFNAEAAVDYLRGMVVEATDTSFSSMRIAVEMHWALASSVGEVGLAAFERGLEALTRELPVTALCQYDAGAFPKELLERAVRAHSVVIGAPVGLRVE